MMNFLKKYNIYVFIVLIALLTIYDFLNWDSISMVRKLVNLFAIFAVLHEIEEKYWPGGFHNLMLKKIKVDINDFDLGSANLIVFIFLLVYIAMGYIFDNLVFFFIMAIILSIFEALIHTAGIKIHNLDKPYTPGLLTAWLMAIAAIYSIIQLNKYGLASPFDYLIGVILFIISFLILQSQVFKVIGISRKEAIKRVRE